MWVACCSVVAAAFVVGWCVLFIGVLVVCRLVLLFDVCWLLVAVCCLSFASCVCLLLFGG